MTTLSNVTNEGGEMSFYVYTEKQNSPEAQAEYSAACAVVDAAAEDEETFDYATAYAPMHAWERKYNHFQWRTLHQLLCARIPSDGGEFKHSDATDFAFKLMHAWARGEPARDAAVGAISPDHTVNEVRYVVINDNRMPIFAADVSNMVALSQSLEDWYVA